LSFKSSCLSTVFATWLRKQHEAADKHQGLFAINREIDNEGRDHGLTHLKFESGQVEKWFAEMGWILL